MGKSEPRPATARPPVAASQASHIYLLPNLMTAGNLFCGFVAIMRCIEARFAALGATEASPQQLYAEAVWFIIAAVGFDSLDGRLARLGGRESLFGREFDSIADVVSFGVAPALLVVFLILSPDLNDFFRDFRVINFLIGFIYLLSAGVRLARFNVITHPLVYSNQAKYNTKDFVGLPAPAAAGVIVSLVLVINDADDVAFWTQVFLPPLMLLIAGLMVNGCAAHDARIRSAIRYPSFKQIDWDTRARFGTFVAILILAASIFFFRQVALFVGFLSYLCFGIVRHVLFLRRRRRRLREISEARGNVPSHGAANNPADSS